MNSKLFSKAGQVADEARSPALLPETHAGWYEDALNDPAQLQLGIPAA